MRYIVLVNILLLSTTIAHSTFNRRTWMHSRFHTVREVLKQKDYLHNNINCILGQQPCDYLQMKIKKQVPFVLAGNCPMCTKNEQRLLVQAIKDLHTSYPDDWNRLMSLYDGFVTNDLN